MCGWELSFFVSTCCVAGTAFLFFLVVALSLGVGVATSHVLGLIGCHTLCGPTAVHVVAQSVEACIVFVFTHYVPMPRWVVALVRRVARVVPDDGGGDGEAAGGG